MRPGEQQQEHDETEAAWRVGATCGTGDQKEAVGEERDGEDSFDDAEEKPERPCTVLFRQVVQNLYRSVLSPQIPTFLR